MSNTPPPSKLRPWELAILEDEASVNKNKKIQFRQISSHSISSPDRCVSANADFNNWDMYADIVRNPDVKKNAVHSENERDGTTEPTKSSSTTKSGLSSLPSRVIESFRPKHITEEKAKASSLSVNPLHKLAKVDPTIKSSLMPVITKPPLIRPYMPLTSEKAAETLKISLPARLQEDKGERIEAKAAVSSVQVTKISGCAPLATKSRAASVSVPLPEIKTEAADSLKLILKKPVASPEREKTVEHSNSKSSMNTADSSKLVLTAKSHKQSSKSREADEEKKSSHPAPSMKVTVPLKLVPSLIIMEKPLKTWQSVKTTELQQQDIRTQESSKAESVPCTTRVSNSTSSCGRETELAKPVSSVKTEHHKSTSKMKTVKHAQGEITGEWETAVSMIKASKDSKPMPSTKLPKSLKPVSPVLQDIRLSAEITVSSNCVQSNKISEPLKQVLSSKLLTPPMLSSTIENSDVAAACKKKSKHSKTKSKHKSKAEKSNYEFESVECKPTKVAWAHSNFLNKNQGQLLVTAATTSEPMLVITKSKEPAVPAVVKVVQPSVSLNTNNQPPELASAPITMKCSESLFLIKPLSEQLLLKETKKPLESTLTTAISSDSMLWTTIAKLSDLLAQSSDFGLVTNKEEKVSTEPAVVIPNEEFTTGEDLVMENIDNLNYCNSQSDDKEDEFFLDPCTGLFTESMLDPSTGLFTESFLDPCTGLFTGEDQAVEMLDSSVKISSEPDGKGSVELGLCNNRLCKNLSSATETQTSNRTDLVKQATVTDKSEPLVTMSALLETTSHERDINMQEMLFGKDSVWLIENKTSPVKENGKVFHSSFVAKYEAENINVSGCKNVTKLLTNEHQLQVKNLLVGESASTSNVLSTGMSAQTSLSHNRVDTLETLLNKDDDENMFIDNVLNAPLVASNHDEAQVSSDDNDINEDESLSYDESKKLNEKLFVGDLNNLVELLLPEEQLGVKANASLPGTWSVIEKGSVDENNMVSQALSPEKIALEKNCSILQSSIDKKIEALEENSVCEGIVDNNCSSPLSSGSSSCNSNSDSSSDSDSDSESSDSSSSEDSLSDVSSSSTVKSSNSRGNDAFVVPLPPGVDSLSEVISLTTSANIQSEVCADIKTDVKDLTSSTLEAITKISGEKLKGHDAKKIDGLKSEVNPNSYAANKTRDSNDIVKPTSYDAKQSSSLKGEEHYVFSLPKDEVKKDTVKSQAAIAAGNKMPAAVELLGKPIGLYDNEEIDLPAAELTESKAGISFVIPKLLKVKPSPLHRVGHKRKNLDESDEKVCSKKSSREEDKSSSNMNGREELLSIIKGASAEKADERKDKETRTNFDVSTSKPPDGISRSACGRNKFVSDFSRSARSNEFDKHGRSRLDSDRKRRSSNDPDRHRSFSKDYDSQVRSSNDSDRQRRHSNDSNRQRGHSNDSERQRSNSKDSDKQEGQSEHNFVKFPSFAETHEAVLKLAKIKSEPVGSSRDPSKFVEYSLFVRNLSEDVTEVELFTLFSRHYPSCSGARIIYNMQTSKSKGIGFVQFTDEVEQKRAAIEMFNYRGLGKMPLGLEVARRQRTVRYENAQSEAQYQGKSRYRNGSSLLGEYQPERQYGSTTPRVPYHKQDGTYQRIQRQEDRGYAKYHDVYQTSTSGYQQGVDYRYQDVTCYQQSLKYEDIPQQQQQNVLRQTSLHSHGGASYYQSAAVGQNTPQQRKLMLQEALPQSDPVYQTLHSATSQQHNYSEAWAAWYRAQGQQKERKRCTDERPPGCEDDMLVDPEVTVNVDRENKLFMDKSDELYDALDASRWYHMDNTSK